MKLNINLVLDSVSSSSLGMSAEELWAITAAGETKIHLLTLVEAFSLKKMGKGKNARALLGRPGSSYIFPGGPKLA